ncbi:hypothetical protein GYMLUDRAFT_584727 [Collybiopsis luxurians FD-317 M1]|uniref:SMP-30/Gluconolactonase/LRE-like region domain-containing protein n=1 Tax=Collybiopsis luxurians FD-317 M1 TaxID=944289 RepID=A0A0D0BD01_9AGAR|nr:hypothetical protein GYMLUDRAFT_584727 [Collybiopsis luxurians FD-317 M1]
MRGVFRTAAFLGSAIGLTFSATVPQRRASEGTVETVYTFSSGTIMENLAIRSNGQILGTIITAPNLYLFDPQVNSSATLVHSFDAYQVIFGIAELDTDQFYVVTGNASVASLTSEKGSWSAWKVDMSLFDNSSSSDEFITKVIDFPDALLLNGIGVLSKENGLLYITDSFAGSVSVLDLNTGKNYVAINNTYTVVPESASFPFGANGVHTYQNTSSGAADDTPYAFFTNSAQSVLVRVPIDLTDGMPTGDSEVVLSGLQMDDFTFDSQGNILTAVVGSNEIIKIDQNTGDYTVVGGSVNGTALVGPSAIQLGRLQSDNTMAYITLNGGFGTVPGAVKQLDLGPALV